MVRLLDLESAWKCSRSDGLEMRIPKVTLKSQIGHLEPVLGSVEQSKIWTIFHPAQWGGRWVGGDGATLPNCLGTNFRQPVHGQSVLSQKMGPISTKMAECE